MGIHDVGVQPGSRIWFTEPSEFTQRGLYWVPCAGRYLCAPNYIVNNRNVEASILMLVDKGRLLVELEGCAPLLVEAGHAVLFDREQRHRYYADGSLEMRWLHLAGANTADYVREITAKRGPVWPLASAGLCEKYAEAALKMVEDGTGSEHILSCTVHRLFAELMTSGEPAVHSTEIALDRAVAFIRERWNQPLTLADMAAAAAFSPYYFTRQFKLYKGVSPYEYVLQLRINEAKRLLYTTDDTVDEIAAACGFESSSYFIRQFRRREQITPFQFRKQRF